MPLLHPRPRAAICSPRALGSLKARTHGRPARFSAASRCKQGVADVHEDNFAPSPAFTVETGRRINRAGLRILDKILPARGRCRGGAETWTGGAARDLPRTCTHCHCSRAIAILQNCNFATINARRVLQYCENIAILTRPGDDDPADFQLEIPFSARARVRVPVCAR